MGEIFTVSLCAVEHILPSLAARILRPFAFFSDDFESGDNSAWSVTLP